MPHASDPYQSSAEARQRELALLSDAIRRSESGLRRWMERRLRDPELADDLLQQTYFQAWRQLRTLHDPSRIQPWLRSIARRLVAEHHRTAVRERPLETEPRSDETRTGRWIWDEVAALSELHREVLELRYRESRSYREIADHLTVPISTVRGRIYEARKALRARLCEESERRESDNGTL